MSDPPKRLKSQSWSTSSVAGAVAALDNYDIVKKELPDDPDELKQMIEAHRMYDFVILHGMVWLFVIWIYSDILNCDSHVHFQRLIYTNCIGTYHNML